MSRKFPALMLSGPLLPSARSSLCVLSGALLGGLMLAGCSSPEYEYVPPQPVEPFSAFLNTPNLAQGQTSYDVPRSTWQAAVAPELPREGTIDPYRYTASQQAWRSTGMFSVQLGAFQNEAEADAFAAFLRQRGFTPFILAGDGWSLVRVGQYGSLPDAEYAAGQISRQGLTGVVVQN